MGLFVVGGGIGLGCEASLMRIIPHQSVQVPPICPFNTWSPPPDSAQIFGECTQPPGKWKTHHYILSLDATFPIIVNYQI